MCVCACVHIYMYIFTHVLLQYLCRDTLKNELRIPVRRETKRGLPLAAIPFDETQTDGPREDEDQTDSPLTDIARNVKRELIEEFGDNTNRHEVGVGLLGCCFGFRRIRKLDSGIQERLDELDAYTYR
jgi:hypothetical protein